MKWVKPRSSPESRSETVYHPRSNQGKRNHQPPWVFRRETLWWGKEEEAEKLIRGQWGNTDVSNSTKLPLPLDWKTGRRWFNWSPGVKITQKKRKPWQTHPPKGAGDFGRKTRALEIPPKGKRVRFYRSIISATQWLMPTWNPSDPGAWERQPYRSQCTCLTEQGRQTTDRRIWAHKSGHTETPRKRGRTLCSQ